MVRRIDIIDEVSTKWKQALPKDDNYALFSTSNVNTFPNRMIERIYRTYEVSLK